MGPRDCGSSDRDAIDLLPDPMTVERLGKPPDATVVVPGSKSITNRALVCAALASGTSVVTGALLSDDTEAMISCLEQLGVRCEVELGTKAGPNDLSVPRIVVHGHGAIGGEGVVLDARLSGTTARFVAPLCVLGRSTTVLDGDAPLRERPMDDLWLALSQLGAEVVPLGADGRLPVQLSGARGGITGGSVVVRGDVSSQFLSGLLLSAPMMPEGLCVTLDGPLVSGPYVELTIEVMRAFGAVVETHDTEGRLERIEVAPRGYEPCEFAVEPDASSASYFFALAAVTGGRVRVEGLGSDSMQGDLGFTTVLASMGAEVRCVTDYTEVHGTGRLAGVEVDMVDISDTAPTLAAIAPLATSPTTVTGIGFARGKETDRIAAVVAELSRLGIAAAETSDGFVVSPGRITPGVVRTYDDHRMAMSFAVLGLASGGVSIVDPGCVAKTFPGFWTAVDRLRAASS
jgi:3-phosphoshikimate 1-carboxyvinyltransferase